MNRFKPGQKVVCVDATTDNSQVISPSFNEIVTIEGPGFHTSCPYPIVRLVEYPIAKDGCRQSFYEFQFEPLVDDEVIEKVKFLSGNPSTGIKHNVGVCAGKSHKRILEHSDPHLEFLKARVEDYQYEFYSKLKL